MSTRRVVVTGLGLVSPLGVGAPCNWIQLTNGISGITALKNEAFAKIPSQIAGVVPRGNEEHELNIQTIFTSSELRSLTPATMFGLIAAEEALTDSNWKPENQKDLEKTGVAVGMGMVDLEDIRNSWESLKTRYSKVSPYFMPRILNNMTAGQISMKYKFQGPNHSVSTACATGCHAIGDAFRMIKNRDADVMVCGGTEASITPLGLAGFCRLRALSTKFNDTPEVASRPFDCQRDGFVMAEGSGMIVLEELEHAMKRETNIYGEILGYGMSGDAYHITAPRPDGLGAIRAMQRATEEAQIELNEVGYINAHATSTPLGDEIELTAIKSLFGKHSQHLHISSTKGATGHLLGAAGAIETIFSILACHAYFIPPTINLNEPNTDSDLNLVPKVAIPWHQENRLIALNNSFGFGGTNACLCVSSFIP